MGVFIREKGNRWYLDIIKNRRHHWRALGIKVAKTKEGKAKQKQVIEELRLKIELQEFRGEFSLVDFDARHKALKDYAVEVAENSKSKTIIMIMVKFLTQYDKHDVSIGGVDTAFIEGFKKYLLEKANITQKSAYSYFSMFKFIMRRAVIDGIIMINPCDKVRGISNCEVEKDVLTAEEIRLLANTECIGKYGEEVKRAFLFACNTGLRHSDIQSLKWGDIVQENKEWILHKRQIKTHNTVDIVLNSTAIALIGVGDALHNANEMIFSSLKDVVRQSTNLFIKRWVKSAGINKSVSWHTARRTFATLLLETGTDVFTTQRLMGHTQIQMTSIYAKSNMNIKAKAVKALDALENGKNEGI